MQQDAGRVAYNSVSTKILIQIAYGAAEWKISGGPKWIDSEPYDVAATLPAGASKDQVPAMMRALLAERFHLAVRRETKEMPVLELMVARNGPKLKPGDTSEQWSGAYMKGGIFKGQILLHQLTLAGLAEVLTGRVDRPVVDMTGLRGAFDIDLKWTPEDAAANDLKAAGPSLYTALQEQLGLKLQPAKAPVEIFIIEHVEKPAEN